MESDSKMEQITKWMSDDSWSKCSKDQLSYFSATELWDCLDRKSPLTVKYPTKDFSEYLLWSEYHRGKHLYGDTWWSVKLLLSIFYN